MFSEDLARAMLAERMRKATSAERVRQATLRVDDTVLTIRPIDITDVDRLERMTRRLSPSGILLRFVAPLRRMPWSALLWLANVDHGRREALVALAGDEIVAVARYDQLPRAGASGELEAELAITVEEAWRRRGVGRELTQRLCALARERGCDAFRMTIPPDNPAALKLVRHLAPDARVRLTEGSYEARLPMRSS